MIDETVIRSRFEAFRPRLDERGRRLFCAAEARSAGYGGVSVVARATGIARSTINRGLKDLQARDLAPSRVRRSGGGRPALLRSDPTLLEALRDLLESTTLGDPMRPLVWVSKSHEKLARALRDKGHRVSASRIPQLLERLGYRRQVNRKSLEGGHHVDRNAQFEPINAQVEAFQAAGEPVISVDTKKKEHIGPYKNAGSDYRRKGCPDKVNVHDFADKELGKAIPYGVYENRRERRLCQRRHRSRHRPIHRQHHSPLAPDNGTRALPRKRSPDDRRRRRRVQGFARSAMESRTAEVRRRDGVVHRRLAHPSGTRSNIGCSVTSRKTGALGRSPAGRRSSS